MPTIVKTLHPAEHCSGGFDTRWYSCMLGSPGIYCLLLFPENLACSLATALFANFVLTYSCWWRA
eukprot:5787118-Lingulodinium_polyedra.AAC.1